MANSNNSRAIQPRTLMLTQFSILLAIQAIFCFTFLGSIPLPWFTATLAHIPVIVTAMLLGWKAGALMGFFFGLFSFIVWTFMPPSPFMAFMFTPFWTVPGELVGHDRFHEYVGNFGSLLICFVPRILIGAFAGLAVKYLPKKASLNYFAAAIIGSFTNTLLVVGGMFIFFAERIEPIWGRAATAWLGAIITGNGIPEAIVAVVLCPAICIPVNRFLRTQK
jgi:uncharacterized membrane protein